MRELKYRAFDTITNKMTQTCIQFNNTTMKIDTISSVILMLYIGLKDVNNVDIYEGDILYIHDGCIAEVVYHKDGFKIKTICPSSEILSRFYSWNHCKIIGNIHQHKELLEVG